MARRVLFLATLSVAPALAAQRTTAPLDATAGRIVFSVDESFADPTGHTRIVLHARTEKGARCYATLGARVATRGDTITIDRWHLSAGDICLDDNSEPPSGIIPVPLEEGRHLLAIAHLGAVDRYRLTITSDAIRVAPIGTQRVSVLRDSTLLWRFPRNSLALRCDTGEHTAWMCAEVFHLLADEPGLVPIGIPPTGRNPYDQRWFGEYDGNGDEPLRYFRVTTPASYARLVGDIQRLHDTYAGRRVGFSVSIRRWTGESWRVERATWAAAP
jgi:hypothetical protein